MRSKTIMKFLTMLVTCSLVLGVSTMTAFAYGNGDEDTKQTTEDSTNDSSIGADTSTVSEDESHWKYDDIQKDGEEKEDDSITGSSYGGSLARDDDSLDVEWSIIEKHDPDGDGILTPVGNLSLVDDLTEEEAENLQYMTVKTKSGSIFYLIVDRSGDEDNVYFLNMVDESDLMALMDEETQEKFKEATSSDGAVKEVEDSTDTVLFTSQDKEKGADEVEDKEDAQEKKQTGANPIALLVIFGIIGAGVAGGYYYFKIKPQKEQPTVDEDMEFYDDEDYVAEETVNEDQEDGNQDAGDDPDNDEEKEEYHPGVDDFSDESVD